MSKSIHVPAPKDVEKRNKAGIKINAHVKALEAALDKQSNVAATRKFIATRNAVDEKRDELKEARTSTPDDKKRIKELKKEKDKLKEQSRKLYTQGPLGFTDREVATKRRQQYVPASMEGLHTAFGARVFTAMIGIGGAELTTVGGKTALHQSLGYTTQSLTSGLFRIVTEIPQVRSNEAGKLVLPSNMATKATFKQSYKGLEKARDALRTVQADLQSAVDAVQKAPTRDNLDRLATQQERIAHTIATMCEFEGVYDNLCVALEKECRGKKASAVVSVVAGAASGSAFAVEPTGAAAVAGHKLLCLAGLLLQMPMSAWDFMDGTVDYPLKASADKIDTNLLIKEKSRGKPLDELDDDEFDTSMASKLWEEKPQAVRNVVLTIARHELSQLNGERVRLTREIKQEKFSRLPMHWKSAASKQEHIDRKNAELAKVERKYAELDRQFALYEQHKGSEIDPDSVIGRAIADPIYFCRKGVSASIFGKVGEFYAQMNQRITNNHNPFISLAMVALAQDVVVAELGASVYKDALHSMSGTGPQNLEAEKAVLSLSAAQGAGALNSGVTVLPARYEKGKDRKALATPGYIAQGTVIEQGGPDKKPLQVAQSNRIISSRKKKRLDHAVDILTEERSEPLSATQQREVSKAQKKWDEFQAKLKEIEPIVEEINDEWQFDSKDARGNPRLDHAGKPIKHDFRASSACMAMYMPALERAWVPVKGIPRSIWQSVTFWKDVIKSKRIADECRPIINRGKVQDPVLAALINLAETELAKHKPAEDEGLGTTVEEAADESSVVAPMVHKIPAASQVQAVPAPVQVSVSVPASVPVSVPAPVSVTAAATGALQEIASLRHGWKDVGRGQVSAPSKPSDKDIAIKAIGLTDHLLDIDMDRFARLDHMDKLTASLELVEIRKSIHELRSVSVQKSTPALRGGMARGRLGQQEYEQYRVLQTTLKTLDMALERVKQLDGTLAVA